MILLVAHITSSVQPKYSQMEDFFSKDEYSVDDINGLIEINAEESINLEFKSAESLGIQNGRKNELAKDVSAFANSDGGIIVYGINESNHKAESISYVDGNTITKEWLEQVLNTRINRKVPKLKIHPIRFEDQISQTVYLIKIPQSGHAPHMCHDKRFYKRYNFESTPIEEYELRDIYNRKNKTQLIIEDILFTQRGDSSSGGKLNAVSFSIRFQIKNVGNTIEELYKLEVSIPRDLYINAIHSQIRDYLIREENSQMVFSIPSKSPMFQKEKTTIVEGEIKVVNQNCKLLSNPGISTTLYYSNGQESRTFNLLEILRYEERPLNEFFDTLAAHNRVDGPEQ